jgi:hypothetical protein
MRKILSTSFVLLALLALATGTVSAAPRADGMITLLEVRNDATGGVIFVFSVSGEFVKNKMNGTVDIQGDDSRYGLHCSLASEDTIQCTTTRKAGGHNVVVYLNGFVFWAFVPAVSGPVSTQYCYNVYDTYFDSQNEVGYWAAFTVHCQDAPANFGDIENIYNPDYSDFSDYEFAPSSPSCYDPVVEDAYYYFCGF